MRRWRQRQHGNFVCLVGIDGSGKTTVAQSFVQALSGEVEYLYVWANLQTWLMHMSKSFFRLLKGGHQAGRTAGKRLRARRSRRVQVFYAVRLIDYARYVWSRIAFPLWRGCNVISDRYAYDVMASMGVELSWSNGQIGKRVDQLLRVLPEPTTAFYLDVPAEVAVSRKADGPSLEYLLARQAVYEELASRYQMVRLDGTQSPEQIVDKMIHAIEMNGYGQTRVRQPG